MNTATLLRGVSFGKVPHGSFVRGHAWDHWRALEQIREVRALERMRARAGGEWHPPVGWVPPAPRDEAEQATARILAVARTVLESLLLGLHAAVQQTGSHVALVHRLDPRRRAFVTCFSHGEQLDRLEGEGLPGHDAACAEALRGRGVVGSKGIAPAQRAIVERLGIGTSRLFGVAMLPVHIRDRTFAMIELGRTDHPFRRCDKARLAGVRLALEAHLEQAELSPWGLPPHHAAPRPLLPILLRSI